MKVRMIDGLGSVSDKTSKRDREKTSTLNKSSSILLKIDVSRGVGTPNGQFVLVQYSTAAHKKSQSVYVMTVSCSCSRL